MIRKSGVPRMLILYDSDLQQNMAKMKKYLPITDLILSFKNYRILFVSEAREYPIYQRTKYDEPTQLLANLNNFRSSLFVLSHRGRISTIWLYFHFQVPAWNLLFRKVFDLNFYFRDTDNLKEKEMKLNISILATTQLDTLH